MAPAKEPGGRSWGKPGTVPRAVVTLEPGRVTIRVTPLADTSIFVPKI